MWRKCGILRLEWASKYSAAEKLYSDQQHPDERSPCEFRLSFSVAEDSDIPIKFIGVWDTVGAVGLPVRGLRALTAKKYQFHDVELSGTVSHAFHALAIDEHRAPFRDSRWAFKEKVSQTVTQRWFCGAHSDVGGGYQAGEWGLSDIALCWLRDQAIECGLCMNHEVDRAYEPKPNPLSPVHNSKAGLYRPTFGIDRSIGTKVDESGETVCNAEGVPETDPTQDLHPSVLERWDNDKNYRPQNLRDYFSRIGDARSAT